MQFQNTFSFAQQLDKDDQLQRFRSQFLTPPHQDGEAIYFLGNSLGLQPKRTAAAVEKVLAQWQMLGVESFFKGDDPWLQLHERITPALAAIVGAKEAEVVAMSQLTVNLHLLLISFYQPSGGRTKILCEAKAFPSDQYALHTHVRSRGLNPAETIIEVQPRDGEVLIREEDILAAIAEHREELALLFWGGVNYYTGQLFDLKKLTTAAQAVGAKAGFDLAHAVGNVPLHLHEWNVDFAAWCSYKYLNAGPGGVGGAFVHERYHTDTNLNRFAGWWGNKKETQFLMEKTFVPEASAAGWQMSTPSPVLYAAHKAALDVFEEAGIENIFEKNRKLNDYVWFLLHEVEKEVPAGTFKIFTPSVDSERGCQVSLAVKNGRQVFDYLSAEGVFADWREPNVIRIAPVGLYNRFSEVWQFAQLFETALHKFAL